MNQNRPRFSYTLLATVAIALFCVAFVQPASAGAGAAVGLSDTLDLRADGTLAPPLDSGVKPPSIVAIPSAKPCAGYKMNVNLNIYQDPVGIGVYLEVGLDSPGGYGGYSAACP